MTETTGTAQTPTEASTSSEAVETSMLTGTDAPATEQQPGEPAKPAEGEGKPTEGEKTKEPAKPAGAPEKYEFKAPEGKGDYDPAVLDTFSAAAKQANLSQEAAHALLENMAPALIERQQAQIEAVRTGWIEASKVDKEFGGANLPQNLAVAKTAMKLASPELNTLLSTTGLGNHPEVIRFMVKVGKAMSEDKFVNGSSATEQPRHIKDILYDKTGA